MFTGELNIEGIEPFVSGDTREVHVHFNDGETVKIAPCLDSWEQYGSPVRHRWKSVSIARKCNDWLHGKGEFPYKN